ncbi:ANTAR domain-containing protein [Aureimonas psammosilenae]|uniref:response regulator n=1 Tax=Aureimonas psammosilenae TaxID=2495496 RepID=UPI0012610C87|nr:response regulator [Aureimonas psammosilenae]
MFGVAFAEVFHRRILIVENDPTIAESLIRFVEGNGGEVVAHVDCPLKALAAIIADQGIDSVFVEADMGVAYTLPLMRQLERMVVHAVWMIGHEGHYPPATAGETTPLVYRLAGDPENVMRVQIFANSPA